VRDTENSFYKNQRIDEVHRAGSTGPAGGSPRQLHFGLLASKEDDRTKWDEAKRKPSDVVLDFEDRGWGESLTGSDYGGLAWETGTGASRGEPGLGTRRPPYAVDRRAMACVIVRRTKRGRRDLASVACSRVRLTADSLSLSLRRWSL
jgi:hypothetical protein